MRLAPASAGSAGPGPLPSDAKCRSVSGTTAWTAGFDLQVLRPRPTRSSPTIALMMWKLWTCVACSCAELGPHAGLGGAGRLARALRGGARGGQVGSWFLKMMIERLSAGRQAPDLSPRQQTWWDGHG